MTVSTRARCNGRVLTPEGTLERRSYELLEEVGRGAAATVWRGRESATGREVAVKVLHNECMGNSKSVARFLQERSILLSLRSPGIVRVRDLVTTSDGALALVMDLVHGGDLRDFLGERGTLPAAEAAALLAQVAEGLAAAHARSVVHRDLKPDNVLVDRDLDGSPRARLTDFGIARVLGAPGMTTAGAVVGTPNYMAPELIEGGAPSAAVDVYALGIVFYELLVGRPPFAGQSQTAILMRHAGAARCQRAGIPKPAWALIQSCIDRDPGRRPPAAALVDALHGVAAETAGVPALPVLAPKPGPRRAGPGRAVLSSFAVVVALSAAAAAGFTGRNLLGGQPPADGDRATASAADTAAMGAVPAAGSPGAGPSRSAPPAGTHASATPVSVPVSVQARASTPARARREAIGPAGGSAGVPVPAVFGPWRCAARFQWVPGHPALARPCYSAGPSVRVMGTMKAAPGVKVDLTVAVQDADTYAYVAAPSTCAELEFSETTPERTCGPFQVLPERGHRYVVVLSWKYSGNGSLPGGQVRGDVLTW